MPRSSRRLELRRHVVQRAIEVVGHHEQLAQQRLAGEAEFALAVLGGSPPEVAKSAAVRCKDARCSAASDLGYLELRGQLIHHLRV